MDISKYTTADYDFVFDNLKEEEGYRNNLYRDTAGIKTIGIGRNVVANPIGRLLGRSNITHISNAEIVTVFNDSLIDTLESIGIELKDHPDKVQYVIISLTFNLGWGELKKFVKFLADIKEKDYQGAAKNLKDSRWFKQVGLRGPKLVGMLEEA